MKLSKINKISTSTKNCSDITVRNNHNFFCNGFLIHNCDYRGEIMIILHNTKNSDFEIKTGDRIAQLVLCKVEKINFVYTDELGVSERNENGLGSTGKNAADYMEFTNLSYLSKLKDQMSDKK